jgi:hypothetical protein
MEARLHLSISIVLFITLTALYAVGLAFDLPWYYWWYDIMLHILGGMLAGFVAVSVVRADQGEQNLGIMVTRGIIAALILGLLWELFELIIGATFVTVEGYPRDTFIDLLCDVSGGILGSLYNYRHSK